MTGRQRKGRRRVASLPSKEGKKIDGNSGGGLGGV